MFFLSLIGIPMTVTDALSYSTCVCLPNSCDTYLERIKLMLAILYKSEYMYISESVLVC